MKLVMKPIEIITTHNQQGIITPVKFKVPGSEPVRIVRVDSVIERKSEKIAGNPMQVFLCQTCMADRVIQFELKYEINTLKWYLAKI